MAACQRQTDGQNGKTVTPLALKLAAAQAEQLAVLVEG
jgi:hypothetical protein